MHLAFTADTPLSAKGIPTVAKLRNATGPRPSTPGSVTGSSSIPESNLFASLMVAVQRGDEAAFAQLYDLTRNRVGRALARTLRAPDQSAEVMQEVYLYAWQHARAYDSALGTVLGWLTMLAHRRAVDRVRAITRARARDHREYHLSPSACPDVADDGIARHDAARLHTAVHRLGTAQREAVALTYLHGYTHKEAAELLSVPLGTLKSRIRAGLANLRALIEPLVT